MNINEILNIGRDMLKKQNIEDSALKAKMLLCYYLKKDKQYLIMNNMQEISKKHEESFFKGIRDLVNGKPIQYITNVQEFMKEKFYVDENVLIPQPDTEILVEEIINICNNRKKILDLCTGSGVIGISLAKNIQNSEITVSDISQKALEVAKKNMRNILESEAKCICSDMFENISDTYDIIVSNPPYITKKEMNELSNEVKNEPKIALYGGEDGLLFYKIIAENAYKYLNENGILALEIGYKQKEHVINLLEKQEKYKDIYSKKDLAENDRIVIAKKR